MWADADRDIVQSVALMELQPSSEAGLSAEKRQAPQRQKIEKLSDVVVESNPYSRLMALQRMGIVNNYEQIRSQTIAIVGIGGVGSVAAEMLTRCGIGRLLMYDYDKVELANMNRLFFRPEHCGMTKTDAAAVTLRDINPDVELEPYTMNITTLKGFDAFMASLTDPSTGRSRVDLVLACVDNYEARITINQVCLELGQTWMESGVSEDAVAGHIQVVIPGETACFECVPPLVVASGIDEKTLKREGVCAASLPTTMGIIAGLLVQNSLKHLLSFGQVFLIEVKVGTAQPLSDLAYQGMDKRPQVTRYLGYSSLQDFFPSMAIKPNPECVNRLCCVAQTAFQAQAALDAERLAVSRVTPATPASEAAVHEDNDWGIEVVPADDVPTSVTANSSEREQLPHGLQFSMPAASVDVHALKQDAVQETDDNLDDLMAQLNSISLPS